jgi:hypothetical protein
MDLSQMVIPLYSNPQNRCPNVGRHHRGQHLRYPGDMSNSFWDHCIVYKKTWGMGIQLQMRSWLVVYLPL